MSAGGRGVWRSTIGACSATSWNRVRAVSLESRKSSVRNPASIPLRSDRHRAEAAVDDDLGARDEPPCVAGEEERRSRELVDVAEPPERRMAEDPLHPLGSEDRPVL